MSSRNQIPRLLKPQAVAATKAAAPQSKTPDIEQAISEYQIGFKLALHVMSEEQIVKWEHLYDRHKGLAVRAKSPARGRSECSLEESN